MDSSAGLCDRSASLNEKIWVLAGTYDEFNYFRIQLCKTMADEGIPFRGTNILYVDKNKMYGYTDMWGYKVGTWSKRKDLDDIKFLLLTRRSSIDEFIEVEL